MSSGADSPTWPRERLADVFEVQLGKMLSAKARSGKSPQPYLRNKNVQWGTVNTTEVIEMDFDAREMERFRLRSGDLLMCEGGVPGRTAIWRDEIAECYYQKAIHRLRPLNGRTLPEFYLYWFRFAFDITNHYGISGASSTIAHLPAAQLKALDLPVPDPEEQLQIARVLSAVQRAIERQERLIALTAELKKALMHKLFTEGTRGEPLKQTEFGPVPESWEIVALGSLAKIGNGSTPKRDNAAYWHGGTIPWLTSSKVHEGRITTPDQYVTPTAKAECHLPRVSAKSLLIAITGEGRTLGNTALVEFDTCVSQHLAYAQFHSADVVPAFLLYFLQHHYLHLRQMSVGAGSTKKALTCGLLKRYAVPLPQRDEQKCIAEALDCAVDKISHHQRTAGALRSLFRTLLHQLMTAQVRVQDLDLSGLDQAEPKRRE